MNEMSENLYIAHNIFHPKPSVFTAPDTTHSACICVEVLHEKRRIPFSVLKF